jgi:aromatic-L-amino-acid decarboxylase
MNSEEFKKHGYQIVDWIADYMENVEAYPVKPSVNPGDILEELPETPPLTGEPFQDLMDDFESTIVPGMTHWQHPRFMGYFPANNSAPSILGEMLTAALGAQCMSWLTSPAATELEERVMEWLRDMIGLPDQFTGVIQDTASTATLVALLSAREQISDFKINEQGFPRDDQYAVYCSTETHSSIEKDVKIAGFGRQALRKIPVDSEYAIRPDLLEEAIQKDLNDGVTPVAVVAALGTTGSTAIDDVERLGKLCKQHGIWLHVDAAFAGTALLLPEYRSMIEGIEHADSFVFNPHKWMFTNFDCSAYYVKDVETLLRTFEILPEYLKTSADRTVNNYRDWGIQLGRRFRALKLWFVIRSYGVEGLQKKLRYHLTLTDEMVKKLTEHPDYELLAPVPLNTICFRYNPNGADLTNKQLNSLNASILTRIQDEAFAFLTHTKLDGQYTIRMVIGQTNVQRKHVEQVWKHIQKISSEILTEHQS